MKGIRNVVIQDGTNTYLINDRKIVEFLFSPNGREIIRMGKTEIGSIKIDDLDIIPVSKMDDDITIAKAAKLLMDVRKPCVLFENSFVTPWDVVMKTIGKTETIDVTRGDELSSLKNY